MSSRSYKALQDITYIRIKLALKIGPDFCFEKLSEHERKLYFIYFDEKLMLMSDAAMRFARDFGSCSKTFLSTVKLITERIKTLIRIWNEYDEKRDV